jgi:hypothetical protein
MIVRETDGGLLLFRQTDHALLSGAFADAWGNDVLPAPSPRAPVLIAAARHDDGWSEWELAPRLGEDGEPVDFIHIPVREHTTLYRRGIDLVEAEDRFAGLVVSLHGQRLYTRPFYPGMDPRIEHLQGTDLDIATAYVEHEHERQERLRLAIGRDGLGGEAEEAWRLLQVWDRLSLLVCMQDLRSGAEQRMPPVRSRDGDVQIVARGTAEGDLICDPYPFAADPAIFEIEAFRTGERKWGSEAEFRHAFRTARRELLQFTCRGR